MRKDPIVEEVRQVRQAYAQRFNYNLQAIAADLHEKEQQHPERLIKYPAKPARTKKSA